jgi:hypothetical protein
VRDLLARHRLALWLFAAVVLVVLFVVFFLAGHGTVSGGSS